MSAEEWRWVPGFEGRYEVSDLGNVRSWCSAWGPTAAPRPMKQYVTNKTYRMVMLFAHGVRFPRTVHQLVMLAFVGPRPTGQEVRHLDDVGTNNVLSNLIYGTHAENMADKIRNTTKCPNGHEYGPQDKSTFRNNRMCRQCRRESNQRYLVARRRATRAGDGPHPADVRAWARQEGIHVGTTGRVRAEVVDAYLAAMQDEQAAS